MPLSGPWSPVRGLHGAALSAGAEEPEKIIQEPGGAVLGCDECLCMYEAWDWFERQEGQR